MFARFLFLINLIVISSAAIADSPGLSTTGFIYNTSFSDTNFQNNKTLAAINVDADYKNFAARVQVGTVKGGFRRGVIEYSTPLTAQTEAIYQIGRFSRVDSFNDGVIDSPSSYQMAMLPLAGNSYRMINNAFAMIDGHNLQLKHQTQNNHLFSLRAGYGKMVIVDQEDAVQEIFNAKDPALEIKSRNNNYVISAHYETEQFHFYTSKNYYAANTTTSATDKFHRFIVNQYNLLEYNLNRFGAKWDNKNCFIRVEYNEGMTHFKNTKGNLVGEVKAADTNYVIGKYFNEYTLYFGQSYGENKTSNKSYRDNFIGGTYNLKDFLTVSLDFHHGQGQGWMKVDAHAPYKWNTWVLSTTYKF